MIRIGRGIFLCLFALIAFAAFASGFAPKSAYGASNDKLIYVVPVQNEIETGLAESLKRAFSQAETEHAAAIVLDINTLGGSISAATDIGQMIRSEPIPVLAYIRGNATSAGSYIALNCQKIAMAPGSTIGAAEVRDAAGDQADPKTTAFWRSEMTAAAEFTHRDLNIAVGMVDRNTEVPGLKQKGELISLSAEQAVKWKMADTVSPSLDDALIHFGFQDDLVKTYHPSMAEQAARFLTQPVVIPILLIVGLLGLTIELLLPGHLVSGLIGATSLGLYFFGNMVAGFAGWESVILFFAGILLLLAELFLPGFGIAGGLGVLALGAGVVTAAYDRGYSLWMLLLSILISAIIGFVLFKFFGFIGVWNRLVLAEQMDKSSGYTPTRNLRHMMFQTGRTVTPLRPAGSAIFHGQRFDVVSNGEFLPPDTEVQIVLVEGTRIVVRKKLQSDASNNVVISRQQEEE